MRTNNTKTNIKTTTKPNITPPLKKINKPTQMSDVDTIIKIYMCPEINK